FEATQLGLGRKVAIKVLHTRRLVKAEHMGAEEMRRLLKRFEREAKAIATMTCPHTVKLFDYGLDEEGNPYMVLEFLDGEDIKSLIKREGALEPERVVIILDQVLESLSEAHAHGVLHRDIKPANIFLMRQIYGREWVKLLDFGLARISGASGEISAVTRESHIVGTPRYMAPEQIQTPAEIDARADLYAVGLVGAEMLSGKTIFPDKNVVKLMRNKLYVDKLPIPEGPPIPGPLEAVVRRLAELRPEDRYQSAEEALEDLRALHVNSPRLNLYFGVAAVVALLLAVAVALHVIM
ncbi:MAG: serine/threonine-protein kinase, partial [Myxococcota bacterium]